MGIRSATTVALALAAAGCGIRGQLAPGGQATHQVRYTVHCDSCRIAYTTSNDRMEEVDMKGMWTKKVPIRTSVTGTVRVTATPATAGAMVSQVTIEVDGRQVAERRRVTRPTFSEEVTLTAPLADAGALVGGSLAEG